MAGWDAADISGVEWFGPTLTATGICSMLIGVVSALLQSDAKRPGIPQHPARWAI